MSNSVSKFIHINNSLPYNQYFIIADSSKESAHISFDTLTLSTCVSVFVDGQWLHVELTKDQITHFLSLDCPDAFIAYALTLCPLSPESSNHTNRRLGCTDKELMGGILKCLQCNQFTPHAVLDANNGYCHECHSQPDQLPDQRYYSQSRFASLSETVPVCSYPVNGSQLPVNLE